MDVPRLKNSSWRDYQAKLQRAQKNDDRKKFLRRIVKFVLPFIVGSLAIYGFICGYFGSILDDATKAQAIKGIDEKVDSKKTAPTVSYH